MKVLLSENTNGYNNAAQQLTDKAARLQAALDAYTALGIATVPTSADLADLWNNPQVFLGRMLTGGQPVSLNGAAGNLAVQPGKVYDLLDKPAGTDTFLASIVALHEPSAGWASPTVYTPDFELNGGQVRVRQAVLDNLLEQYRYYATTQRQKDVYDATQAIAASLETIRQNGFGDTFYSLDFLQKALVNGGEANKWNTVRVNTAAILHMPNLAF